MSPLLQPFRFFIRETLFLVCLEFFIDRTSFSKCFSFNVLTCYTKLVFEVFDFGDSSWCFGLLIPLFMFVYIYFIFYAWCFVRRVLWLRHWSIRFIYDIFHLMELIFCCWNSNHLSFNWLWHCNNARIAEYYITLIFHILMSLLDSSNIVSII